MTTELTHLIQEYTTKVWEQKEISFKERCYKRLNPRWNQEYIDIAKGVAQNQECAQELEEHGYEHNSIDTIVKIAQDISPEQRTGLAIGYLFPDEQMQNLETPFRKGFNTGQVYRLKKETSQDRRTIGRGITLMALGHIAYAVSSPYTFTQDNLSLEEAIGKPLTGIGIGSILYGVYPMIKHKLFGNDAHLSKELITSGQFSLHRNPFYTGLISGFSCLTAKILSTTILTENPNWFAAGITTFGLAVGIKGLNDYARKDEEILEKQFGEEYIEYKKQTPRFIPNVLNIFRSKK